MLTVLDRKVACDKTLPICRNCRKDGRICGGYGFRLSWGHPGNRRRHAVSPVASSVISTAKCSLNFVNTSYRDTTIFYKYYNKDGYGEHPGIHYKHHFHNMLTISALPKYYPILRYPTPLRAAAGMEHDEAALILYCKLVIPFLTFNMLRS
jgi:hypothetical protein